jgi:hypothetical protein
MKFDTLIPDCQWQLLAGFSSWTLLLMLSGEYLIQSLTISDYLQGAATVTYFRKTVFYCSCSSFVKAQSFESKSPK